jgi:hypothetical protein
LLEVIPHGACANCRFHRRRAYRRLRMESRAGWLVYPVGSLAPDGGREPIRQPPLVIRFRFARSVETLASSFDRLRMRSFYRIRPSW